MKTLKVTLSILALILLSVSVNAQTFLGGGFGYATLSQNGFDDVNGLAINIQRQFYLKSERWSVTPSAQISLLPSKIERDVFAFYATTLSIAPNFSYDLIKTKHLVIAPYVGPFAGWLRALRSADPAFEAASLNEFTYGIETGLSFLIIINEEVQFRLLPIHFQFGNQDFKQGSISLLMKL